MCPCWTPRLQLQWYNKALADTWYNFVTRKINFCHKWCTTRFWMERLDNSDDISRGCELGQITRLKNQGVLSSQGQREGFVHREAERCFRAIKLCPITIERHRGPEIGCDDCSAENITGVWTWIKYVQTLMTLLCLLKTIKHVTNSNIQSWGTITKYPLYCTTRRNHNRKTRSFQGVKNVLMG